MSNAKREGISQAEKEFKKSRGATPEDVYRLAPRRSAPIISGHLLLAVNGARLNTGKDGLCKRTYMGGERFVISPQSCKHSAFRSNPNFSDAFDSNNHFQQLAIINGVEFEEYSRSLLDRGFSPSSVEALRGFHEYVSSLSDNERKLISEFNIFESKESSKKTSKTNEEDKDEDEKRKKSASYYLTVDQMKSMCDIIISNAKEDKNKVKELLFRHILDTKHESKRVCMNGSVLFSRKEITTEGAISFAEAFSVNKIKEQKDYFSRNGDISFVRNKNGILEQNCIYVDRADGADVSSGVMYISFKLDVDRYILNHNKALFDGEATEYNIDTDKLISEVSDYITNAVCGTWGAGHGSRKNDNQPLFAAFKIIGDTENDRSTGYSSAFAVPIKNDDDLALEAAESLIYASENDLNNSDNAETIYCFFNSKSIHDKFFSVCGENAIKIGANGSGLKKELEEKTKNITEKMRK